MEWPDAPLSFWEATRVSTPELSECVQQCWECEEKMRRNRSEVGTEREKERISIANVADKVNKFNVFSSRKNEQQNARVESNQHHSVDPSKSVQHKSLTDKKKQTRWELFESFLDSVRIELNIYFRHPNCL